MTGYKIIDVRDLANFTIDCLDQHISGTFNTVTPTGSYSMGELLADSQAVAASKVAPVWVDEAFVAAAEANTTTQNWGMFPIRHPRSGDAAAASSVS
ncbi:MAG: hypothetical protein OEW64_13905 [Gammaproteobacteria bacterium]|nr:hypothetical protein [Gammaproteobacteria bacterium]MDH5305176.1 hypothetical protein [Gammaproteobacteria bacterium]MDH5323420.1 hypothetical protein [Gammaproteobacteria bacterium]